MELGMIGLGRMGANMARRLMRGGHGCVVYDHNPENTQKLVSEGANGAATLAELVSKLKRPRAAWVMVPAGAPTEETLMSLAEHMDRDDILIDGGNSYYKDDARRAKLLKGKGIRYVDVGTSGGIWGLERGYCLMIGGEAQAVESLGPIFKTLAPGPGEIPRTPGRAGSESSVENGYLYCGPAGAGHFVKMVHNGIEYGVMQAFAEGFDILRGAQGEKLPEDLRYALPLAEISEVWRRGSVLSSWLLDLTASALFEDPDLKGYTGFVEDSGEGRWTVMAAIEEAVPAEVITGALFARFRSRQDHTFAEKVLSAMRHKFGGHVERPGSK
ncbi:MAG TPA: decarboxylating 6-phosphogluconate dehydrogenase [Polyangiaceae bacterium]|jgi:6-phosphogluconate dehydrogenase